MQITIAQDKPYSQRMAQTAMKLWSDTASNIRWTYDQGVIMRGVEGVWKQTGDKQYFKSQPDNNQAVVGIIAGFKLLGIRVSLVNKNMK